MIIIIFFRGEIFIIVHNCGCIPIHLYPTVPVAQLIILPYVPATIHPVNGLSSTIRGNLGFGRMTEEQAQRPGPSNTPHPVRGNLDQRMALPGVHTFLTPR